VLLRHGAGRVETETATSTLPRIAVFREAPWVNRLVRRFDETAIKTRRPVLRQGAEFGHVKFCADGSKRTWSSTAIEFDPLASGTLPVRFARKSITALSH
jgi:hypothetical protein